MKVAKLVYVSLLTRVIVEEGVNEETIMELAIPKLSENLMDSPYQNVDKIVNDIECPYIIGEEYGKAVGDEVEAPEPNEDDLYMSGGWVGTIKYIKEDTDESMYAGVEDCEGDVYDIEISRLIKVY